MLNRVANISSDNNNDEKLEVVQNAMLSIINQDLLLNLKDSKYFDRVVPNNPNIKNNDKNLKTVKTGFINISERFLIC